VSISNYTASNANLISEIVEGTVLFFWRAWETPRRNVIYDCRSPDLKPGPSGPEENGVIHE